MITASIPNERRRRKIYLVYCYGFTGKLEQHVHYKDVLWRGWNFFLFFLRYMLLGSYTSYYSYICNFKFLRSV